MSLPYHYAAFGLSIASAVPLPELVSGNGTADVEIRRLAPVPPAAVQPGTNEEVVIAPDEFRLTYDDVGVLTIRAGDRIDLEPLPGASSQVLRLTLLGPAMAALLHQRGFVVLHASVVEVNGRAVAFLGQSGAGKSTLAAACHARGHRILADDVAAIRVGSAGPEVCTGFPQLKLWPDALKALGRDVGSLPRVEPGLEKRADRLTDGFVSSVSLPLHRLYALEQASTVSLTPLGLQEGFRALLENAYGIQQRDGVTGVAHFRVRSELIRRVPISRLSRPRDLRLLSDIVDLVEHDAASNA